MKNRSIFFLCFLILIGKASNIFSKEAMKNKNVNYKNVYFVILAGGSGTRLWPLSKQAKPKQFLEVGERRTLIEQAIARISPLVPKENIWISTTEKYVENINTYVGDSIGNIVVEPGLRNTAPAILLACMELHKTNPEALVIFLPSDPFIPDTKTFISYVKSAVTFIKDNRNITLFGIKPTYPATGYGYIEFDNANKKNAPYPVLKFHEKPSLEVAKEYIKKDNMVWNICMFCGQVDAFLNEFKTCAPNIFDSVQKYVDGQRNYNDIPSDSIDYAVMEKSKNIFVIPSDFQWCDVGNIEVFLTIQKEALQLNNNVVSVNSKNNLIDVKDKLVALVGINNLCIVEANGVLLITKQSEAEKVKHVVQQIKHSKNAKFL